MIRNILFAIFCISTIALNAQTIKGRVSDKNSNLPLDGVQVLHKKTGAKTLTDSLGNFTITAAAGDAVEFSSDDIEPLTLQVPSGIVFWDVAAENKSKAIGAAVITHNRLKEKLRESPVTVESIGIKSIKETPASDFYESLGHLRGVDVTAASLGFRIVNTRGFNSTSPVRSLQLIDGVDNQAPGLNFSLGNFLGASELDVASTEIVVGASSAYYGPNAFNGVISMTTKDPWKYQGFSAQLKVGERDLGQIMMRYAKSYKNKKGRDVFAFKMGLSYMRAFDWVADNYEPTADSKAGMNNPGGYDAVNRYGDEVFGTAANDQVSANTRIVTPGLGAFYRDGYQERDLVNYNTRNLKTNLMLAYKINDKNELQYGFNFGTGTTVYQGDNRYSLNGILFFQNRIELIGKKGHLRLYATNEDAGNTYDAVLTSFLMQGDAKPGEFWYADYQNYWFTSIVGKVKSLPGYNQLGSPNPASTKYNPNFFEDQNNLLLKYNDSIVRWHNMARAQANTGFDHQGNKRLDSAYGRLVPGTPEFQRKLESFTQQYSYSKEGGPTGSRFFDRSALYHATGERRFTSGDWKFTTGFSARLYRPYTNGTIFLDTGNRRISNREAGAYAGFEKRLWSNRWKLTGTGRVDKNENFPVLFSPAASLVYSKDRRNTWRTSYSSAIRNPTLQDQYLYYNVGRAILLGNIDGVKNVYELETFVDYLNTRNLDTLKPVNIPAIRPEGVRTAEIGYKGILAKGKVLVDAGYYISTYRNFIGYRLIVDAQIDTQLNMARSGQLYRVASNSQDKVRTQGLSAAVTYLFADCFMAGANWSWNQLDRMGSTDPLIPAFNTPRHKFNVTFGAADMKKTLKLGSKNLKIEHLGFNVNFKWVEGFRFEGSPQFTGDVPRYWTLDAQVNRVVPKWNSTLKLGASNLTNNMVYQVYGGPRIGRMIYFSITYEP